jgi:heme/copper-type cytochrome/quinol oxidase subunit 1
MADTLKLALVGCGAISAMHLLGLHGMPRRVYTYPEGLGFEFWNQVETAGSFILGLSFLVFIWNVIVSKRSGEPAPADPWNGATLEWSIPSPAPYHNYDEIPTVHRWPYEYSNPDNGNGRDWVMQTEILGDEKPKQEPEPA